MNASKIRAARHEAERFIQLAIAVEHRDATDLTWCASQGGKETGALRRASMDLTRALAEMRKP